MRVPRVWASRWLVVPVLMMCPAKVSRSTIATVDWLLHHAHIVLTEGTSLRLAEATAGKEVIPLT